jgi:hypothetical protein
MAKVTKAGGPSGWPHQTQEDGTDSSASTEQQAPSSSENEQHSQSPAPTTELHSEADQTEGSTAPSMGGQPDDDRPAGLVRESDEGVGLYDTWRKDDLAAQTDVRELPYNSRTTSAELIDSLREDDATAPS